MVAQSGEAFVWNDNLYKSDIVMGAIRPYVNAIGKTVAKHIMETVKEDGGRDIKVNPEPYIRFLLEEPNPFFTGQKFREQLATSLKINNHAFALIIRDENGLPTQMYYLNATMAIAEYDEAGHLRIRFYFLDGKSFVFAYSDLIHLRGDVGLSQEFFGGSKIDQLLPLMELIGTIDRGIIAAIKNGAIIRWLLKFHNSTRPEDLDENAKKFAEQFLGTDTGYGVAAVDSKAEAIQVKPNDYVPNAIQTDRTIKRFYAALNTNEKIVMSSYNEDEWNAFYESQVEPDVIQMGNEFTRKLFSRKKRSFGNRILFEASNLATASMATKLALKEMVDRGAMSPNEWRAVFNRAPVPGGDVYIRRLDTAEVKESEVNNDEAN
jgi:HK97 family phage portal protein